MDLISIYNDTLEYSKNIKSESITKKHTFEDILPCDKLIFKNNITVENIDTVSAAIKYNQGRTAVLNMASYKRPGGGVARGARAQEESLFRCSNLTNIISQDLYPLNPDECLYTSDAVFFKDFHYNQIPDFKCDVITIAAFNLSNMDMLPTTYESVTKNKIRLMCCIPSIYGVRNLILGAWGCGVYGNDPNVISSFYSSILKDEGYSSLYDKVIFAIINDHNSVANNYKIFKANI